MRKVMIGSLAAMTVLVTGCATTRGDVREARRDAREARAYGDRDDVRDANRELRKTRRDYRRDNQPN